jgi:hypothetical protein
MPSSAKIFFRIQTLAATATIFSLAATSAHASILPPNDLDREDNLGILANITEVEFKEIIEGVVAAYRKPAEKYKAKIVVNALWSNSTVNASAQQMGNQWIINMYGGLARRPEVTPDGFALVVCHELGHHFAGFSFKGNIWAANEGQSDYFATQSCAKEVWGKQKKINATFRDQVGAFEKGKCDTAYAGQDERDLCYRSAAAGLSLGTLLAKLRESEDPKFDTPSQAVVRKTDDNHPEAQCRLDTYFQAALCTKKFDPMVIPGKKHPKGQGSLDAEKVAAKYSCTEQDNLELGNRPACWFKSRMQNLAPSNEMAEVSFQ